MTKEQIEDRLIDVDSLLLEATVPMREIMDLWEERDRLQKLLEDMGQAS